MERETLKNLLRDIRKNECEVPENIQPFDLALKMTDYIGDLDDELRDDFIYTILATWMVNDVLTAEEIHKILDILLDDNHLFYKIGEYGDALFTRTFSVLMIAVTVYKHRQKNFLNEAEVNHVLNRVVTYVKEEKDLRGFVEGKGWGHGVAHAADALDELARCTELEYQGLKTILETIRMKMSTNDYTYIHEEDERMVTAVTAVLERGIIEEVEIIEWINAFGDSTKGKAFPDGMITQLNIKNFLRSLYFRLIRDEGYTNLTHVIRQVLEDTSRFK